LPYNAPHAAKLHPLQRSYLDVIYAPLLFIRLWKKQMKTRAVLNSERAGKRIKFSTVNAIYTASSYNGRTSLTEQRAHAPAARLRGYKNEFSRTVNIVIFMKRGTSDEAASSWGTICDDAKLQIFPRQRVSVKSARVNIHQML